MQAPPLDEDYDYYSTKAPTGPAQSKGTVSTAMSSKQQPRVRKGLGAMPRSVPEQPTQGNSIREQQQQQHRGVDSPSNEVEQQQQGLDPPASSPNNVIKSNAKVYDDGNNHNSNNNGTSYEEEMAEDDDDALLDLDQLEELHDEAERMKALGNKHMAAQVSKIGKIKNCDVQTELEHNIIIFRQKIALSICLGKIDSGRKDQTNRSTIYSSHFIQMIYSFLTFNNEKIKSKFEQEYTRAYNAYSAALQLSPVGPSSHVFLSNRSAALLSLKRYSAAAIDARRAIALAPTFGKAHARLGQSLYFLKDYEGAVTAYEDAIHYEPDNPITKTYLEKARSKWNRQKEKSLRNRSAGDVSVLTAESSIQPTIANSVATDPNASAAVVTTGFRGQSKAIMRAVGGSLPANKNRLNVNTNSKKEITPTLNEDTPLESQGEYEDEDDEDDDDYNLEDPDFDEALRIQERANRYLANKNYKYAIEEYTAALFLIPDDENLSPELHLGRAHALNGSRRHESAKIDSQLALKIKPTPEAYSTLAKSLFYMKDYEGSIVAFGQCKQLLPPGETLSMFDRAYLLKAEAAIQNELKHGTNQSTMSSSQSVSSNRTTSRLGSSAPIPKLKPPKFVSREEVRNFVVNDMSYCVDDVRVIGYYIYIYILYIDCSIFGLVF